MITRVEISVADRELLLDLAEVAVRACLRGTHYPGPDTGRLGPSLLEPCDAYVVVRLDSSVFGCAGETETGPLGACVPELALHAAFDVGGGRRLSDTDLRDVDICISVVETRRPVPATTRAELLGHLDAGAHGLTLTAGEHHATLLPSAWAQRPDPDAYVDTVMRRAGLDPARWPTGVDAELIDTVDFCRRLS